MAAKSVTSDGFFRFSDQRTALCLIDIQPQTLKGVACDMLPDIRSYVRDAVSADVYDAYIVAEYEAPEGSMLDLQTGFVAPYSMTGKTDKVLLEMLERQDKPTTTLLKQTRSAFVGKQAQMLEDFLQKYEIGELHFIGFDINDCVLASAYGAMDRGYYSFVLEDFCHHNSGDDDLKQAALTVLRRQKMTDRSSLDRAKRTQNSAG